MCLEAVGLYTVSKADWAWGISWEGGWGVGDEARKVDAAWKSEASNLVGAWVESQEDGWEVGLRS
jgi:hypothetical protein